MDITGAKLLLIYAIVLQTNWLSTLMYGVTLAARNDVAHMQV